MSETLWIFLVCSATILFLGILSFTYYTAETFKDVISEWSRARNERLSARETRLKTPSLARLPYQTLTRDERHG